MTNEKKNTGIKRGSYKKDLLRKVIHEYGAAWHQIKQQLDRLASGACYELTNNPIKIQPPNFVEVVLIPVITSLAETFPEYNIQLPVKGNTEPDKKGYFLVRIGEQVIVGINFGGADAKHIKITLFPNPLLIDSMENLRSIVTTVIRLNAIPKKVSR